MSDSIDRDKLLDALRITWLNEALLAIGMSGAYFACDWPNAKLYSKYRDQVFGVLDLKPAKNTLLAQMNLLQDLLGSGKLRTFTQEHFAKIDSFCVPVTPREWHARYEDNHTFWDLSDGGEGVYGYEKLGTGLHITVYCLDEGKYRAQTKTPRCLWTHPTEVQPYVTELDAIDVQHACQQAYDWAVVVTGLDAKAAEQMA